MTYSKLGNIKGPQGRRGLNMTGGTTPPPTPTVDDNVLEGDLWLDSTTGDVYRATIDPWAKDGTWTEWGTVLWKVADNVLMIQPTDGDTGTMGEGDYNGSALVPPWCGSSENPSRNSMTSVLSKGRIVVNEEPGLFCDCSSLTDISSISNWDVSNVTNLRYVFSGCTSLTDISDLSNWDVSNMTNMEYMFLQCPSLTDISPLSNWNTSNTTDMAGMFGGCTSLTDISSISNWDVSNMTNMEYMFSSCPLERIGIPSLAHGGKNFVSKLKGANVVTDLDSTMLTNTTTHETMSANQILADMDTTPSKYATGTVWTIARA